MGSKSYRILVVEDDPVTLMRHAGYFEQAGYEVLTAGTATELWQQFAQNDIDLILLDVNLPDEDGMMVTRMLRGRSEVGIILVTGRSDAMDKIVGLEMGADDYVTKPVEMRELLVRVKNLLWRIELARRGPNPLSDQRTSFQFSGWQFDLSSRRLSWEGEAVHLTTAEYELLAAFVRHPQQVLPRERLLNLVSNRVDGPDERTIDVLVRRLRAKMEKPANRPKLFVTVHGEGYLFGATVGG